MEKQKNKNEATATGGKKLDLCGNATHLSPDAKVLSVYQTQAISETSRVERNVPLVNDANVTRERNWSIENQK